LLLHAERFLDGRSRRRRQAQDLITVETQWIEFKGKDLIRVRNYIRLFVTGNSEWLVPAGYGERRFAIFDMAARKGSCLLRRHRSTRWTMGGREALLHYLFNFDLSTVNLRTIPKTVALLEQQISSLTAEQSWWLDTLMRGELPRGCDVGGRCPTNRLFHQYITRAMRQGIKRRSIEVQLGGFLKKHVPGLRKVKINYRRWDGLRMVDDDGPVYIFPSLEECREAFATKLGQPIDWAAIGRQSPLLIPWAISDPISISDLSPISYLDF
jgi:hypothetical protein